MPNKVLLFQEGSCHNLKDFCYVQVRYFDQLRDIAAVAGFSTSDQQLCKMKMEDFCLSAVIGQLHVGSVNCIIMLRSLNAV